MRYLNNRIEIEINNTVYIYRRMSQMYDTTLRNRTDKEIIVVLDTLLLTRDFTNEVF